ncbi:TauD/TfdA family dioxygenase [Nostoc sp. NMS8]|uniref:TauD/TfdA family dioxygenase n=1 Tax=Nostoc sp. NMS8 TaxID=2815392 RepID=UPI0025EBA4F4|nr:TauD/TfdA family dioxygenase [Nostoc sp. NMS8]MBN3958496.1 TauD/TfdA family dioxygenase [Nostoc sp. NMS8]
MNSKIESLGIGTGKTVYSNNDCEDILCLSEAETLDLFKSSGVVLFRDFRVTVTQMKAFSEKFSCSYLKDPTKKSVDSVDFVTSVDNGMYALPPHAEHSCVPIRPDVVWFCCKTPVEGGETLFWDGIQIWKEMSKQTKQLFDEKKLKFVFENVPLEELNKWFLCGETIDECKQVLNKFEGLNYQINEDSTISLKYICSAVVKTKYGNQDAFANYLWVNHTRGEEIFEDGSKLPDEVADEIQKLYDKYTEEISWQAGDLVMIDNSRVMHGRREFKDNQRQIFVTISNLNLE